MTSAFTPARSRLALLVAALVTAVVMPGTPAAAAEAYEIHYVPSVDGALLRVEIQRDTQFDAEGQPVILTYSPYNSLGETTPADDGIASRYNPRGYARATADVLGTRGSEGCWDYGGAAEQQSGVDVVKFLAGKTPNNKGELLDWSSGAVGMVGGSYEGTTATMVAARGDEVPELKAIVPIAAISRWYGYAFKDGVRYFLNSKAPTDEGFDTPLAFDLGFGRTVPADPEAENFGDVVAARTGECGTVAHTQEAYSRSPDYSDFWLERDYLKDAESFRAATMVVHGWQDYNVKQEEGTDLFEALPVDDPATVDVEGVPQKLLIMSQATHGGLPGMFTPLQDRFFDRYLKGIDTGIEVEPMVHTLGRTHTGAQAEYATESAWPPPATQDLALHLGRFFDYIPGLPEAGPATSTGEGGVLALEPQDDGGGWTHANPGTVSEEHTLADPTNRTITTRPTDGGPIRGHGYYSLFQESAPLTEPLRIAGSARLDTFVNASNAGQHLTPVLAEVLPDGTTKIVERGFLNLDYAEGLTTANPASGWIHGTVEFLPQDYTFSAGSRVAVILQGSNTVWAVPGNPGTLSYAMGPVEGVTDVGTRLLLPVVDLPADTATLFTQ
jgi:X-Pro dipeptidyl-peptidase